VKKLLALLVAAGFVFSTTGCPSPSSSSKTMKDTKNAPSRPSKKEEIKDEVIKKEDGKKEEIKKEEIKKEDGKK